MKPRYLALRREAIRVLHDRALGHVGGGDKTHPDPPPTIGPKPQDHAPDTIVPKH